MEDSVTDQTWTQQPLNQLVGSASSLVGDQIYTLETGDGVIEELFQKFKAATVGAGLSMGRQPNRYLVETGVSFVGPVFDGNDNRGMRGGAESGGIEESTEKRAKGCKRESSSLVAMALEMSSDVTTVQQSKGNFYDCNICLNITREPILTCCGHLFCWACFCKLPYANSIARDCPVCKGEVSDCNIIPIYGDGDSAGESSMDSFIITPPRPKAQRVESVRQWCVARGFSNIPVAEALRRIRTSFSTRTVGVNSPEDSSDDKITLGTLPRENFQVRRTSHLTRGLSENAALSSISLVLNNEERLVEDLETYFSNRQLQRSAAPVL